MRQDVRDRLVLPVLLPIGILVLIGAVLWGFSRILLGVTATAATTTAIVVAGAIVAIASIAAGRTTIRGSTIAAMFGATAGAAMLVGGIALAVVGGGEGHGGEAVVVRLAARNIAFQPTSLSAPAGEAFTIAFNNEDQVEHNVHIFDNEAHDPPALFEGPLVPAATERDYEVGALEEGTYYFLCTIHPQMTGEIEAAEGGGEGPGPGGPGVTVRAVPTLTFDTNEIVLPADQPSTITFDNQEAGVQHNISIYAGEGGESLFEGEVITGPAQTQYPIPPLPAGEAYFQCDIHPTMNGTVRVE
jgi:plastocyanin